MHIDSTFVSLCVGHRQRQLQRGTRRLRRLFPHRARVPVGSGRGLRRRAERGEAQPPRGHPRRAHHVDDAVAARGAHQEGGGGRGQTGETYRATLYDFRWDMETKRWVPWEEMIDTTPIPPTAAFKSSSSRRWTRFGISSWRTWRFCNGAPIPLLDPQGAGKSVYLQGHLNGMDKEKVGAGELVGFLGQNVGEHHAVPHRRQAGQAPQGILRSPHRQEDGGGDGGRPEHAWKEAYGAQPDRALASVHGPRRMVRSRQLLPEHTGRALRGSDGTPGGGRSPITQRYQRHYNLLSIVEFDNKALEHIFGTILGWFYETNEFPEEITVLRDPIIAATLDVYNQSIAKLLPPAFALHLQPPRRLPRHRGSHPAESGGHQDGARRCGRTLSPVGARDDARLLRSTGGRR